MPDEGKVRKGLVSDRAHWLSYLLQSVSALSPKHVKGACIEPYEAFVTGPHLALLG